MFCLRPISTDNLISLLGFVLTLLAIIISVYQFNKTIKNTYLQQKNEISLKRVSEISELLDIFARSIVSILIYSMVQPDKEKHIEASKSFDETMPKIKSVLLMYGSNESVKLFQRLRNLLIDSVEGGTILIADVFALVTLLYAQVRLDITNIRIDSKNILNLLLPEAELHEEDIAASINVFVSEFSLDPSLKY